MKIGRNDLESRFPEKILEYYRTGRGALNVNDTRKGYARKAKGMAKVRHMYVDPDGRGSLAGPCRKSQKRQSPPTGIPGGI
jgi:hypothetical protein